MNPNASSNQNRDERDQILADYLGGELDAAQRARFEASLAGDPEFAAEVAGLRAAIDSMRSLDPQREANPLGRVGRRAGLRVLAPAVRYAAVIAVSVLIGYLARGGSTGEARHQQIVDVVPTGSMFKAAATTDWERRAADAYAKTGGQSSMSRSLIALATAAQK